jgi:predicted phosphodiesterase
MSLSLGFVAFVLSNAAYTCLTTRGSGIAATVASIYFVAGLARGESRRSKVVWLVFRVLSINAIPIALLPIELYAPSTVLRPAVVLFPMVFRFPLMISISFTVVGLLVRVYRASVIKKERSLTDRLSLSSRVSNGALYALSVAVFGVVVGYSVSALLRITRTPPWRGPYLQSVTLDSVWVVWDTVKPSVGLVEYGLTPELGRITGESQAGLHHEVQLTGLSPQSVYYYRVDDGEVSRFRTAPASRKAGFRFAVVGDTRTNHRMHRAVVGQMVDASPDLVLHTGDLVESGRRSSQWDRFFWIEESLLRTAPFYPALGGHEERASQYLSSFTLPGNERWYTFEYGCAHFIALQIDGAFDPGYDQLRWLERQLGTNDSPWLFVYFHVPVYSSRSEDDLEIQLRHTLVPLFERYGVDAVFMGHQHSYERIVVNGITYIVTAGGGAPLYRLDEPEPGSQVSARAYHYLLIDVDPGRVTGTAIDRYGRAIDRFGLAADR